MRNALPSASRSRSDRGLTMWNDAVGYETYVGHWSRAVAPRFLAWLALPIRLRWLDVACGTGALTSAILARCDPEEVVGLDASACSNSSRIAVVGSSERVAHVVGQHFRWVFRQERQKRHVLVLQPEVGQSAVRCRTSRPKSHGSWHRNFSLRSQRIGRVVDFGGLFSFSCVLASNSRRRSSTYRS
jgi:hypothetical protein